MVKVKCGYPNNQTLTGFELFIFETYLLLVIWLLEFIDRLQINAGVEY